MVGRLSFRFSLRESPVETGGVALAVVALALANQRERFSSDTSIPRACGAPSSASTTTRRGVAREHWQRLPRRLAEMDGAFERRYGREFLSMWGHADRWPPALQMTVAMSTYEERVKSCVLSAETRSYAQETRSRSDCAPGWSSRAI